MIHCRNYMASRSSRRNYPRDFGMWRILRAHVVWQSLPPPLSRPHDVSSRFRIRTNPVHALVPLTRNHGQQGFLQASGSATKYRCPHMLHNSRAYHPRNLGFVRYPSGKRTLSLTPLSVSALLNNLSDIASSMLLEAKVIH